MQRDMQTVFINKYQLPQMEACCLTHIVKM